MCLGGAAGVKRTARDPLLPRGCFHLGFIAGHAACPITVEVAVIASENVPVRTISSHPFQGTAELARHGAHQAYDAAAGQAATLRDRAMPTIRRAAHSLADGATEMRWAARRASYRGVDYMREHPVPSALMVGAAAALVFIALRAWALHER